MCLIRHEFIKKLLDSLSSSFSLLTIREIVYYHYLYTLIGKLTLICPVELYLSNEMPCKMSNMKDMDG